MSKPTIVGPGAVTESEIRPEPKLQGLGQDAIVTVFNPLSVDFAIMVGQSKPVDLPIQVSDPTTQGQSKLSEVDINRTYGVGLKNVDHVSKKHFTNQAIIKAGKTMRFTGDVAQVAVRQIVNELMQREGNTKFLADPVRRREAEERVAIHIQSQQEFMNDGITTVDQQVQEALNKANEVSDEKAFPGLTTGGGEAPAPEERADTAKDDTPRGKKTS